MKRPLVVRLREKLTERGHPTLDAVVRLVNGLCDEAANRIEQLEAQIAGRGTEQSWQSQAYAKLGHVRDMMLPADVRTVQQFIGIIPEHGKRCSACLRTTPHGVIPEEDCRHEVCPMRHNTGVNC